MSTTLAPSASSALPDPYDGWLDINQAAAVRNPSGKRRYGSLGTIRRAIEGGALPTVLPGGPATR